MTSVTATATYAVEEMAQRAFAREEAARATLAARLTGTGHVTAAMYAEAMSATAKAAPWRDVNRVAREHGLAAAVIQVRDRAVSELLQPCERPGTGAVMNEMDRLAREELRFFLIHTDGLADQLEAEELARHAPPAPADPAPAAVPARRPSRLSGDLARRPARDLARRPGKAPQGAPEGARAATPTAAQLAVLEAVAAGGAKVTERRVRDGARARDGQGRTLNMAVVLRCTAEGWINRDTSTSLYEGQALLLTDAGRAHLRR